MNPSYSTIRQHLFNPRHLLASLALLAVTQTAFAQPDPNPLGDFARENGGTEVQIAVADAVMNICPTLANDLFMGNVLTAPDSPDKDLTLRCGELIQTSVDFNDPEAAPPRSLDYTDPDSLLSALQEVSGEELNSQSTMTVRTSNSQAANIAGRMNAIRIGTLGAGSSGVASAFNLDINGVPMVTGEEMSPLGGAASADGDGSISPLGWFVNGSYNTGDSDDTDLQNGIDFDSYGITAGMDYRFNNNAVVGASIGYDDFDADFDSTAVVSGGDLSSDGFTGALFGLMEFGDFYVDGVAMYGQLDYEMNRRMKYNSDNTDPNCQCPDQDRKIESDTEGNHYTLGINSGWVGYIDSWMLQPSLGLSYRNYEIDGYTEKDTFANGGMELRYDDQEVESLRSNLGLRVSRAFNQSYGVLMPTLSMDWYHEFEDDADNIKTKYAQEDELARTDPELGFSSSLSDCLSCFTIRGEDPDADYGVIGAGMSLILPNQIQLLAHYEGLVGYDDLTSYAFTISIRGQF